ncbi:anti-sigma factor [Aquabacterium humicola]|uniref:anti-sigma factor n=1 Tax=Aquabacterium humicola TaxID=3237377 RepID=UPI0025436031|nr:zf-HC2 domain-containing protein [Rubrivivax pictus]
MSSLRFQELLPFYVNGSLQGEERAWVEQHIAENADARTELEQVRALQQTIEHSLPDVPATIGLDRVMTRIRADQPGLLDRLAALLGLSGGLKPGMAFAGLAIIAVQAGVIVSLVGGARTATDDDITGLRAPKATAVNDGPLLKVNFAPDAKEAEIRHLLVSVQGRLAGGPGQLGDYYIAVPAGREAALAEQVRKSPIVQAVSLAPGLPPRD